jgi:hypothetical protein
LGIAVRAERIEPGDVGGLSAARTRSWDTALATSGANLLKRHDLALERRKATGRIHPLAHGDLGFCGLLRSVDGGWVDDLLRADLHAQWRLEKCISEHIAQIPEG